MGKTEMKKTIALVAASAALLFAGAAQAQMRVATTSPLYGELGYTFMKFKADGGPSFNTGLVRGIVGYEFHPNFAGELMLAAGTKDDTSSGVTIDPRSAIGLYLKPKTNLGGVEVFGRLGWTQVRANVSAVGVSGSGHDNDFSYGFGANINVAPRWTVGADWMRYTKKDGLATEGPTVSVGYRF
jgi:opacity protein-like surface antigen